MRIPGKIAALLFVCLLSVHPFSGLAQESPEKQTPPTATLLLRVALVDEKLDIKPVPRFPFILQRLDQVQEPVPLVTNLDGNAKVSVQPGVYKLRSGKALEFEGNSFEWVIDELVLAEGEETALELSNDNAAIEELPQEPVQPERRIAEETILFQNLRNGVVTVEGEVGHGSGFIIDDAGLILTNHHVVYSSQEVRIRFDENRKVEAKILATDPQKDVAVLWVNLEAFPEYVLLPLIKPEPLRPSVVEGEKVIAIGSPLSQQIILTVGVVSKVEERAIISDINVNPGNSGGPLINSLGEVVGIVTFGERAPNAPGAGISGIVRIEEARDIIREARSAMRDVDPPSAELLPVEPETKFPVKGLAKAITAEKYEVKDYHFELKDYDVYVVSPVLRWYFAERVRIDAARLKLKERKKKREAVRGTFDPLQDLKNWVEYLGQYEAVVDVYAIPEVGETGGSIFWRSLAAFGGVGLNPRVKFKAEFYEMTLKCDGEEIIPIQRGKHEVVGTLPTYLGRRAHYTFEGMYTYPYEYFDPQRCRQLVLTIYSEEEPTKPDSKVIKPEILERVWADFAPYREIVRGETRP